MNNQIEENIMDDQLSDDNDETRSQKNDYYVGQGNNDDAKMGSIESIEVVNQ